LLTSQEISDIVSGCIKLERESQKKFYTFFYSYAMAICMRYATNNDDAMEVVNDGFLKIFKKLSSFEARYEDMEGSLKGWIKRIMLNTAIDHFRKNNKYIMNTSMGDQVLNIADQGESSLDKMSYEEIYKLVQNLSPMYRTVFNLYIIDGFKHEEIAKKLNISVGTSKSNLAKAKINIQKMMQQAHRSLYEQKAI
jgi:RNA polymerase sigma-70 factor (ECF subfamily)